jgi:putative oxidoreductase
MEFSKNNANTAMVGKIVGLVNTLLGWLSCGGKFVAPPVMRVALALPFFRSGLTRWDSFLALSPSANYLFAEEFKLHIFGGEYSIPSPDIVAYMTGLAEITLPILLILGLATRFSALGLLAMTGVIQLVVPDGWINFHLYWAALAVGILAMGPGFLSVDRQIIARMFDGTRKSGSVKLK